MTDLPQTCPSCGSSNVVYPEGTREACACADCLQLYVPENRLDPAKQLCDDCAWRPGSPERQDEYRWAMIVEATIVKQEHPFYCHKGMACELNAGGNAIGYIRPESEADMKPCAGWRAHLLAYQNGISARKL